MAEKQLPCINVAWNEEKQLVGLGFDPAKFRSWDFVCMVLRSAVDVAEHNLRMCRMQALQQQAAEAQVQEQIRQELRKGFVIPNGD